MLYPFSMGVQIYKCPDRSLITLPVCIPQVSLTVFMCFEWNSFPRWNRLKWWKIQTKYYIETDFDLKIRWRKKTFSSTEITIQTQYTMHSECIQTPSLFHILLCCSFVLKLMREKKYWNNLHSITHNDKAYLYFFGKCIKKEKLKYRIDISIPTLYSVLSWSTFGSDYSLKSSWVWPDKLCTPEFWDLLWGFVLCRSS